MNFLRREATYHYFRKGGHNNYVTCLGIGIGLTFPTGHMVADGRDSATRSSLESKTAYGKTAQINKSIK